MKISIVKETYSGEERVLMLPEHVGELVGAGHDVFVEKDAGAKIAIYDRAYEEKGATVIVDRKELFGGSDMVVKLKAPSEEEFALLDNNILFSMLHHNQNPEHVYYLGKNGAKAVEIESVFDGVGRRLVDATDITGEVGVLYAVHHMKKMPQDSKALILGYGRVGSGAISMCNKLGIESKILRKEEYIHIKHFLEGKDLLVNAISWPEEDRENKRYLVTEDMIGLMNPHGVVLDLSVDFPNPIQTCRPTTLNNPFYREKDRVHIGIYGYPGLVPISSAKRYSGQVLPIVREIADNNGLDGLEERSDIGRYISRAIVDPDKLSWRDLEPKEVEKSFIE